MGVYERRQSRRACLARHCHRSECAAHALIAFTLARLRQRLDQRIRALAADRAGARAAVLLMDDEEPHGISLGEAYMWSRYLDRRGRVAAASPLAYSRMGAHDGPVQLFSATAGAIDTLMHMRLDQLSGMRSHSSPSRFSLFERTSIAALSSDSRESSIIDRLCLLASVLVILAIGGVKKPGTGVLIIPASVGAAGASCRS